MSSQYPRLLTSAVGTAPNTYRGVLWRVMPDGSRVRLADCPHKHRQPRKAQDCAQELAYLDGAPRDVQP